MGVLCDSGFFFCDIKQDQETQEWGMQRIDLKEMYLKDQSYSIVVEYDSDKFVAASLDSGLIIKFSRDLYDPTRLGPPDHTRYTLLEDPNEEGKTEIGNGYTDLQLIKGYDAHSFPYVLARSLYGIIAIDLKNDLIVPIVKLRPLDLR